MAENHSRAWRPHGGWFGARLFSYRLIWEDEIEPRLRNVEKTDLMEEEPEKVTEIDLPEMISSNGASQNNEVLMDLASRNGTSGPSSRAKARSSSRSGSELLPRFAASMSLRCPY
jgi:hypothetical protein